MQLVQKLTAKTLGWDRNKIGTATTESEAPLGRVHLGRIVGIVAGLRQSINNDTGEVQSGLKGNFRGISSIVKDGAAIEVTSGVCYLPSGIQSMIEGELAKVQATDKSAVINFAIDLYALRDANKAGYTFDADNIVESAVADPLADLLAKAGETKALPGAAPAPALEDANKGKGTKAKADA